MAVQAGQAWIQVNPSLRGFHRKLRQDLAKELANDKYEIPFEPKVKPPKDPAAPFRPYERQAPKSGADAGGGFARAFRQRVDAALKAIPDIRIDADTSEADTEIAGLRTRLQALRDLRLGVDIDTGEALAEIQAIQQRLRQISGDDARIDVRADTAAAAAQLAAIDAQVSRLDGRQANVDVNVDRDRSARSGLNDLSRGAFFANSQIGNLAIAGALIAPALVPAFGAATVAAGGLLSMVTSVGVGITGFVASVVPAFSNVLQVTQAMEAADKSAATTAVQSGQQRVNTAYQTEQAARRVQDAQIAADRASIDGARRVADAREQVARAHERAADIIAAAERRVADAALAVADAQEAELDAQQALTEAREDAIRTLEEMRELVSDLALSAQDAELALQQAQLDLQEIMGQTGGTAIEAAQLNLADAQEHLNAVMADGNSTALEQAQAQLAVAQAQEQLNQALAAQEQLALDQQQAALDVAQAEDHLNDLLAEQQQAQQDLADAEAAGIDGMAGVVAAQEALQDASQNVADALAGQQQAQEELADAQVEAARTVADAQEDLARAQEQAARANEDAARAVADALAAQAQAAEQSAAAMDQGSAASRNLAYAMGQLTPMQRLLLQGWLDLRDAFRAWATELEPDTIPVFLEGFELLKDLFPLLTPIVQAVARALRTLLVSAREALQSPFWQDFFAMLGREAGPQTENFGRIIGNLATGFAGLMKAFAPTARNISDGLVDWTAKFAAWGTTLDENDQFQGFLDYVEENWPKVKDVFSELGRAVKNLVDALAPLGGPTLDAIAATLGVIADMDPDDLAAVAGGLTGITIALRAMAVAAAFNPVVLIVGAIAGLAYWLIYTWQTSEEFRDKVTGAFETMRDGVFTVIVWLSKNVFQPLGTLFGILGQKAVAFKDGVVKAWNDLNAASVAAKIWLNDNVFNPLGTLFRILWDKAVAFKDGVVGAWNSLNSGVNQAKIWLDQNVIQPAATLFQNLWDRAVEMKDGIVGAFQAIPEVVGGFFGGLWDTIKGPLNTVFGFINDMMIGPLNLILQPFDLAIPELPKLHVGGYVDGVGEKPFMLLGGEGVLNPTATKALGGKDAIDDMNRGVFPWAMGGPFGFDWPDWASWDVIQQGLALGTDIATGNAAGDFLEAGLLSALKGVVDTVNKNIGAVISGPQFVDVPVERKVRDYGAALLRWAEFGHANIEAPKAPGGTVTFQGDMAFPLPRGSYRVGSPYGPRNGKFHNGWDFPAAIGTPIFAPFSGRLTQKNVGNTSYGRYAEVVSGAMRSVQAHMSAPVGGNRFVQAGDTVGRVGSTGNSSGPHLHQTFEVNGRAQNPRKYLKFDSGGYLMPGLTIAYNGTGVPERILDPADTYQYERGASEQITFQSFGTPKQLVSEVSFALAAKRQSRRPLVRW